MDVVGSEIGQKMRSAIKAKLTELGCYVDDELPDYVMVMVANKRTRSQMEEDLQLFLGDNTLLFVNWLHHVLRKLQEVTVTSPPPIIPGQEELKNNRSTSKERKGKERKEKKKDKHTKSSSVKKAKRKSKTKERIKQIGKKLHKRKQKKKSKDKEMIRPKVPPLLMNMEKESEPSITDIFAGQILKNHGISLSDDKSTDLVDIKPFENEIIRPVFPIIDPSTITATSEGPLNNGSNNDDPLNASTSAPLSREEQLQQMNATEARIKGLRQKLVQQLGSMSDDEDMLTLRAEAEELINDFNDGILQELADKTSVLNPAPSAQVSSQEATTQDFSAATHTTLPFEAPEVLPQIELNLPKWPAREKLKAIEEEEGSDINKVAEKELSDSIATTRKSTERLTPDKDLLDKALEHVSSHSQLRDDESETKNKRAAPELSDSRKRFKRSAEESLSRGAERASPASVVMVRPRPKTGASSTNLLMRAVADAHKSLLTVPPKLSNEQRARALVLPIRRASPPLASNGNDAGTGTGSDIVIKVNRGSKQGTNDEYVPHPLTKKVVNTNYTPTLTRATSKQPGEVDLNAIDIHRKSTGKEKGPTFVVTLDGLDPNIFLAKKLKSEGILDDEDEVIGVKKLSERTFEKEVAKEVKTEKSDKADRSDKSDKSDKLVKYDKLVKSDKLVKYDKSDRSDKSDISEKSYKSDKSEKSDRSERSDHSDSSDSSTSLTSHGTSTKQKRFSDTSEDSYTQVIIKGDSSSARFEKERSLEVAGEKTMKKRKGSPIIFDVDTKRAEPSKAQPVPVTMFTSPNTSKYEAMPSFAAPIVPAATASVRPERKSVPCSMFPMCRYGASCAFTHPPCKFASSCTRRGCVYAHPPASAVAPASHTTFIASHVVPAPNYKSISTAGLPNLCKYYPNCANPVCHFFHPKPCRYGRTCGNKLDCNFYHYDGHSTKWRSTM